MLIGFSPKSTTPQASSSAGYLIAHIWAKNLGGTSPSTEDAVDRLQWLNESGLSKQTPDQASKIGAVLFSLWAKGHRERSKAAATFIPLVSGVFGLVLALLLLPEPAFPK